MLCEFKSIFQIDYSLGLLIFGCSLLVKKLILICYLWKSTILSYQFREIGLLVARWVFTVATLTSRICLPRLLALIVSGFQQSSGCGDVNILEKSNRCMRRLYILTTKFFLGVIQKVFCLWLFLYLDLLASISRTFLFCHLRLKVLLFFCKTLELTQCNFLIDWLDFAFFDLSIWAWLTPLRRVRCWM